MNELDQAAVEAAGIVLYQQDSSGLSYYESIAEDAIRAYQTAMAPQVREAVGKVVACAERFAGTEAVNFGTHEELEETERDLIDAKRTLLELLGAQEETE
jgi:hypothetical protein